MKRAGEIERSRGNNLVVSLQLSISPTLCILWAVAACSGGGPGAAHCEADAKALASVEQLRGEGWLHQALEAGEAEQRRCPSEGAASAVAAARADLGLDRPAPPPPSAADAAQARL